MEHELIWKAVLDERYEVEVVRTSQITGTLTVKDRDGSLMLSENTHLSYGAAFGPDVGDVEDWMTKALNVVDEEKDESCKNN